MGEIALFPKAEHEGAMLGFDFKQAALMGDLAEAVELGGPDGVGQVKEFSKVKRFHPWLAAIGTRHEIDVSARIDWLGVCVWFFHNAAIRRGGHNFKGAVREHVNPCSYGWLCHPRRVKKTNAYPKDQPGNTAIAVRLATGRSSL